MAYIGYALAGEGLEFGILGVLARVVPRWWIWAAFVPLIARGARTRDPADRPEALAWQLVLGLVLSVAHLVLWAGYRRAIGSTALPFGEDLTRLTVNFLVLNYITFLAIAGALQVRRLLSGIRSRERERARLALRNASLQARLAEARLQALASQLRPHFLFNALNAVSELVHQDPPEAERMIARLGDLLRLVLARTERHEVSLAEEMEVVDAYLAIERSRFRGRLETSIDLDAAALRVMVPTLSVQPLVENAVRHGVERDRGTGTVTLRARLENGCLCVAVMDDGQGPGGAVDDAGGRPSPSRATGDGIGLANTRARLGELYGDRASLELEPLPAGGTRAVLRVPLERDA
jgi:sensor histidine kinase YesM